MAEEELLLLHNLRHKVLNHPLPPSLNIHDVNLYLHNPQDLVEKYDDLGENKWYFFTPRDRKYKYGTRPNRAAGNGYWKASSIDRCIKYMGQTVGYKKTLVFYEGKSPKGIKTNWIMRECRINDAPAHARSSADDLRLNDCVLCIISYKKLASGEDKSIKEEDKDEAELVGSSYKGIELIGSSKNDERVDNY
ncbi:hypothetical protein LguiA_013323 [Lonicera macranthoides]